MIGRGRTWALGGALVCLAAYGTVWSLGSRAPAPSDLPAPAETQRVHLPAADPAPPVPCYVGVSASPGEVDVPAPGPGLLAGISVSVGDAVRAGQELASIEPLDGGQRLAEQRARTRAADAAVAAAEVEVRQAEREMERRRGTPELFSTEQIEASQFALDLARLELDRRKAAREESEAALERLRREETRGRLTAPFDGRVSARWALPGTSVEAGAPVLRLVAGDRPLVRFAVPAADVDLFPVGVEIHVETRSDDPRVVSLARVETLAPVLDEASQLIFVEARSADPAWSAVPVGAVLRVGSLDDGSCRDRPVAILP